MDSLGRLKRIELRDCWPSGASGFTRWLATKETIADLGQTLGIELELKGQQWSAGSTPAEVACKEIATDRWVLIGSQLEQTDHKDLGRLLTCAAGLEAATFVWVAARFSEEHRATLDWLNRITDERLSFFGVELELWRIGNSPAAPIFKIVSSPAGQSLAAAQDAPAFDDAEPSEVRGERRSSAWASPPERAKPAIDDLDSPEPQIVHESDDRLSPVARVALAVDDAASFEIRSGQRPSAWAALPDPAEPAIDESESPELEIFEESDKWSPPVAQAAPEIGEPEPVEIRSEQETGDWSPSFERTEAAIDDIEPSELEIFEKPDEEAPSVVPAASAVDEPAPAEAKSAQRPSRWSSPYFGWGKSNMEETREAPVSAEPPPAVEDPEPFNLDKGMQRAYWTAFDKVLRAADGPVGGGKKPQPQSWMAYSIGRSHFLLMAAMFRLKVRAELFISGDKAKVHFYMLKARKEQIEAELGYALDWEEMPAEKNSRISISLDGADPEDEADWPRQHRWLAQRLNEMHRALSPWISAVDDLAALAAEKKEAVKVAKDSTVSDGTLSTCAFAVYWRLKDDEALRNAGIAARELAHEAESLLELFPNARIDDDEQDKLRASLGRPLLGLDKKERVRIVDAVLAVLFGDSANLESRSGPRDHYATDMQMASIAFPRAS